MICPECGYDMGRNSKCLRCGFAVKTLMPIDESKQEEHKEDVPVTKVIDPAKTYLSDEYGNRVDDGGFVDPFDVLFGDIFDPIGDILSMFGFGGATGSRSSQSSRTYYSGGREEPPKKKKRPGDGKIVEVKNVEIVDDNGNPIDTHKHKETHADDPRHPDYGKYSSADKHSQTDKHSKIKNKFRRKPPKHNTYRDEDD